MKVSRRDFLQSASTAFGVTLLDRIPSPDDLENTIKKLRVNVLEMINEERAVERFRRSHSMNSRLKLQPGMRGT